MLGVFADLFPPTGWVCLFRCLQWQTLQLRRFYFYRACCGQEMLQHTSLPCFQPSLSTHLQVGHCSYCNLHRVKLSSRWPLKWGKQTIIFNFQSLWIRAQQKAWHVAEDQWLFCSDWANPVSGLLQRAMQKGRETTKYVHNCEIKTNLRCWTSWCMWKWIFSNMENEALKLQEISNFSNDTNSKLVPLQNWAWHRGLPDLTDTSLIRALKC